MQLRKILVKVEQAEGTAGVEGRRLKMLFMDMMMCGFLCFGDS